MCCFSIALSQCVWDTGLYPTGPKAPWGLGHLIHLGVPCTCCTVGAHVVNEGTPITQAGVPNTRCHCFCVSCSKKDKNRTRAVTALRLCKRTLGKFYLNCVCKILLFSTTTHCWDSVDLNYHQHLSGFRHPPRTLWRAAITILRLCHDKQQPGGQVAQVQIWALPLLG